MSTNPKTNNYDEDEQDFHDPRHFYDQGWFWVLVVAIVLFFFLFRPYLSITITH